MVGNRGFTQPQAMRVPAWANDARDPRNQRNNPAMLKKIEPWELEDQVKHTRFFVDGTLTVAIVELHNGMKLVGHSACLNPADFNADIGESIARENAVQQLWPLMGYYRLENEHPVDRVEHAGQAEGAPSFDPAPADDVSQGETAEKSDS